MRIVSGINPSSARGLHIGNYFGAVERFIKLQSQGECFYFVANLHTLNATFDPKEVQRNTDEVFLEYLALGIDPEKSVFFVESDVPEIPYLQTILNNVVTVAELKRMHGYKDKLAKDVDQDTISAGLFEYPVLMAADILLFSPDIVPVGEDQAQHVEITREIARTFNNRYGEIFTIPEPSIEKRTARVIGVDGVRKMGKSLGNDISLFGDEALIKKQIMSITTDPARIRPTDPGDPAKNIAFTYLRLMSYAESEVTELENRYRAGTVGDVDIKHLVIEQFLRIFAPARARHAALKDDTAQLRAIRERGAERARSAAQPHFARIRTACGV